MLSSSCCSFVRAGCGLNSHMFCKMSSLLFASSSHLVWLYVGFAFWIRLRIFWFSFVIRCSSRLRRSLPNEWEYLTLSLVQSMPPLNLIICDIFSSKSLFSVSICANLSSMRKFFFAFVFKWVAARGHLLSMLHFMSRSCKNAMGGSESARKRYLTKARNVVTHFLLMTFLASLNMPCHASFVLNGHCLPSAIHGDGLKYWLFSR